MINYTITITKTRKRTPSYLRSKLWRATVASSDGGTGWKNWFYTKNEALAVAHKTAHTIKQHGGVCHVLLQQ